MLESDGESRQTTGWRRVRVRPATAMKRIAGAVRKRRFRTLGIGGVPRSSVRGRNTSGKRTRIRPYERRPLSFEKTRKTEDRAASPGLLSSRKARKRRKKMNTP